MMRDALDQEAQQELAELPPSAKLVCYTLAHEQPLTQSDLVEETMLSNRTVRYALTKLEESEIVRPDIYIPDARQNVCRLN
jgi:predicted transcriptional regulator